MFTCTQKDLEENLEKLKLYKLGRSKNHPELDVDKMSICPLCGECYDNDNRSCYCDADW